MYFSGEILLQCYSVCILEGDLYCSVYLGAKAAAKRNETKAVGPSVRSSPPARTALVIPPRIRAVRPGGWAGTGARR